MKIKIVFFHRKPYPIGNYSLEFIFNDIRKRLSDKLDARVFISTFYSKGLFRRLFNAIEVIFKQRDVNFITGDIHYISLFLKKKKTILTILDCGFLYGYSGIKRWLLILFWLKISVMRVKYITTISESTKSDILKHTNCDPGKIFIIPVAIDEKYIYTPRVFNKNKPVLLQVGQAENKNLKRIIKAIKGLDVKLSIVGKISVPNKKLLKENNIEYSNCYNINNNEMIQKYIECDILVFPSLYEGFGMPIIEAQAIGRPVVTSNISSMPWVAGNSANLVNPFSTDSIREGINKIIQNDIYRQELIKKGLANAKRFNPNLIASMYYEVIQKAANKN